MVQNFEFKDGYGVYKLRPPVGRSKMKNKLHVSPILEESIHTYDRGISFLPMKDLFRGLHYQHRNFFIMRYKAQSTKSYFKQGQLQAWTEHSH